MSETTDRPFRLPMHPEAPSWLKDICTGAVPHESVEVAREIAREEYTRGGPTPPAFEDFWNRVLGEYQDGDCLWEWAQYGGPLASTAGLAIERAGECAWTIRTAIA